MARPEVSIKHIPDSSLMPQNLTRGRIYFIEDEGILKVNHGRTTGTYGNRGQPGPPGPPGEPGYPIPELQEQIDALTETAFTLAELAQVNTERSREMTARQDSIQESVYETARQLSAGLQYEAERLEALIAAQEKAIEETVFSLAEISARLLKRNAELEARITEQEKTLSALKDMLIRNEIIEDPQEYYDVIAMLDDVFDDKENDSDIEDDDITAMLNDIFAGEERLNEGDSDGGFNELLDDAFR